MHTIYKSEQHKVENIYSYNSIIPSMVPYNGPLFIQDKELEVKLAIKNYIAKTCSNYYINVKDSKDGKILSAISKVIRENHYITELSHVMRHLGLQIPEDIVVHSINRAEKTDKIIAVHACLPFGWRPIDIYGKSMYEIHKDVPGLKLNQKSGFKLAETCVDKGPFIRYVWTLNFGKYIDSHPNIVKAEFNPNHPRLVVKIEKQITYGLPEFDCYIFILNSYFYVNDEINFSSLYRGLSSLNKEQIQYKGLSKSYDLVMSYLERQISNEK